MKTGLSLDTAPRILASLLNNRPQMLRMCVFPDRFSFSSFLDSYRRLYNLKISSLNSALTFTKNKLNFYGGDVLVSCSAKFPQLFQKF